MDTPTPATPFHIPDATVRRWQALDFNKPLNVPLTRADLENLFFAIDFSTRATQSLQYAVIEYTNGRLDEANKASAISGQNLGESANRLRLFMNSIMASAELET